MGIHNKGNKQKKYKLEPFAYYIYFGIVAVIVIVIILQYLVVTPFIQSPENLNWYRRFLYFDYMFLLFFSLASVFAGLFLSYVGFGGNKKTGIIFIILGLIVFTVGFLYFDKIFPRAWENPSNVYQALVSVLATIAGFLAAIMIAFLVITKVGPHIPHLSTSKDYQNNRVTNNEEYLQPSQHLKNIENHIAIDKKTK